MGGGCFVRHLRKLVGDICFLDYRSDDPLSASDCTTRGRGTRSEDEPPRGILHHEGEKNLRKREEKIRKVFRRGWICNSTTGSTFIVRDGTEKFFLHKRPHTQEKILLKWIAVRVALFVGSGKKRGRYKSHCLGRRSLYAAQVGGGLRSIVQKPERAGT